MKIPTTVPHLTAVPGASRLADMAKTAYFSDCYQAPVTKCKTSSEAYQAIFGHPSPMASRLMAARNAVVGGFGLKQLNAPMQKEARAKAFRLPYEPGQRAGMFTVKTATPTELVLGEDDKHLDFRISVLLHEVEEKPVVAVSTVVNVNSLAGVAYMAVVKPFHGFLASRMVKSAAESGRL